MWIMARPRLLWSYQVVSRICTSFSGTGSPRNSSLAALCASSRVLCYFWLFLPWTVWLSEALLLPCCNASLGGSHPAGLNKAGLERAGLLMGCPGRFCAGEAGFPTGVLVHKRPIQRSPKP